MNVPVDIANVGDKMFIQKCVLRRGALPVLPCDCAKCEWYINDSSYNSCFWVLAHYFDNKPGTKLSFQEIATLEGITEDEASSIFENAMNKVRRTSRNIMKSDNFNNVS
jgi:hypothetical protein